MTYNLGIGIVVLQAAQQGYERLFLSGCAGIGSTASFVQSALVTHAYAVGIVVAGVYAHLLFGSGLKELAVALNVVMIANALVTKLGVVADFQILDRKAPVTLGGAAMHYNQVYQAHDCTAKVPRMAVIAVAINLRTFATFVQLILLIN